MKIAYVTNIAMTDISGGFSAMNAVAYETLSSEHDVTYVGPINPKQRCVDAFFSKACKLFGIKRAFYYFSTGRLMDISRAVRSACEAIDADLDFFHGFTPWVLTDTGRRYVAWSDCTFEQYISLYFPKERFLHSDIRRICFQEAEWLKGAESVWFRNRWAAENAIASYGLDPKRTRVVGNYGFMALPDADTYSGSREFLFVSTNFLLKGGMIAVEAIKKVLAAYPEVGLKVIGDRPPEAVLSLPFVEYLGFFDKSSPGDVEYFKKALAGARALIHPTCADTNPMVIIEAGYHGCPSISTPVGSIPYMIRNGETGVVIPNVDPVSECAKAINRMITDNDWYSSLRQGAWRHTRENYSPDAFKSRFIKYLNEALESR